MNEEKLPDVWDLLFAYLRNSVGQKRGGMTSMAKPGACHQCGQSVGDLLRHLIDVHGWAENTRLCDGTCDESGWCPCP